MILRPYQDKIIDDCRTLMIGGVKNICIQSETGSGKTVLAAKMLSGCLQRNWPAWFIVHRKELIDQTAKTFQRAGIPFGLIAAGEPRADSLIQICGIQTLVRNMPAAPRMIILDEAQHCGAATWDRVYEHCGDAFKIGPSATPCRLDGKPLGKYFQSMVRGPSTRWLMDNGYLSNYVLYAPDVPDMDGVRSLAGDYSAADVEKIMAGSAIVGSITAHWKKLAAGKLTIGFSPTVAAAKGYAAAMREAGIRSEALDAKMPREERKALSARFAAREIDVLWNVDIMGEGYDLAAHAGMDCCIEAVILARPTKSLGLLRQQIGRALRPKAEPAVILDHAGNCLRHEMMPDSEIEWSLDGKPKVAGRQAAASGMKRCGACFMMSLTGREFCEHCGGRFEPKRKDKKIIDAELKAVEQIVKKERRKEDGTCRSYEDFLALAASRGYSRGWAFHKAKARGYI